MLHLDKINLTNSRMRMRNLPKHVMRYEALEAFDSRVCITTVIRMALLLPRLKRKFA